MPQVNPSNVFPTARIWSFLSKQDRDKVSKAGYATPRGGAKGAYQNHVLRCSKVIIPYEKLPEVDLARFRDGYVIRLWPEQAFSSTRVLSPDLTAQNIVIGTNAFVLYRTHEQWEELPPMKNWRARRILKDGVEVSDRGPDVMDDGHYVCRIAPFGKGEGHKPSREEGAVQGIFAPEYAPRLENIRAQLLLVWLITRTVGYPLTEYTPTEFFNASLVKHKVVNLDKLAANGVIRRIRGEWVTICPLCNAPLHYHDLHEMLDLEDVAGLANSGTQVEGATRSTKINLFHLRPLTYSDPCHTSENVAWGHATCNTRLGQLPCVPLQKIKETGTALTSPDGKVWGWGSSGGDMVRAGDGSVYIRIAAPQDKQ